MRHSLAALGFTLALTLSGTAQVSVTTQHNDLARTGANLRETVLTPANVNGRQFGMLFKRVLDDQVYGQPLVAAGLQIAGGQHDVVYLTTVNNSVYAFDANDATAAAPLWHVNFGAPPDLHSAAFGCLDMNGKIGIVGAPVIDPVSNTLYVVALTKSASGYAQRLHALDLATGADLPNSPATIAAPAFDPLMQNQRPALMLANGTVYIGYASHCDKEPYHGFLLAYNAKTLAQTAVLNTTPTGSGASIWQSGQAPALDEHGNIYIVTGNGSWDGKQNFSESFMKLDPHLKLLDWFTPTNHQLLDDKDNDLDSSGATILPGTHLMVGGGKEGVLYTIDMDHLGHLGDEHAVQRFPATSSHLHSLVYWKSAQHGELLYIWGQRDKARVYHIDHGHIDEKPVMLRPIPNEGHPGAMLSLSANGGKDGVLWAAIHASGDSWHESRPGILHAYDADDITHELWNSLENPGRDDCGEYSKMAPPTIANGKVFLASFGTKNVGAGQFCVYGLLANGPAPAAPTSLNAELHDGEVRLSWAPVAGAHTYAVRRVLGGDAGSEVLASGLTAPALSGLYPPNGRATYVVVAQNANGESLPSPPAGVTIGKPAATDRPMVMH